MKYKTGLRPSPHPPKLRFADYFVGAALPAVPATFGHYNSYPPRGWNLLGNDQVGDCTCAGAGHCVMLWNKIAGHTVTITTADTLDDYSAITGYDPNDPSTDQGADIVQVAKYWQQTGFRDDVNRRHKIAAYLEVNPKNLSHVDAACYLFGAVGLGILVGDTEEREFDSGTAWEKPGSDSTEGHYVPMVGKTAFSRQVVTWGGLQSVGEDWLKSQLNEVVAMVSQEALINGKSAEGFDFAALSADLEALG